LQGIPFHVLPQCTFTLFGKIFYRFQKHQNEGLYTPINWQLLLFGHFIFVHRRFADFINCHLVKWLKRPNSANIVWVTLIAGVKRAVAEIHGIRLKVPAPLRGTPIVVI